MMYSTIFATRYDTYTSVRTVKVHVQSYIKCCCTESAQNTAKSPIKKSVGQKYSTQTQRTRCICIIIISHATKIQTFANVIPTTRTPITRHRRRQSGLLAIYTSTNKQATAVTGTIFTIFVCFVINNQQVRVYTVTRVGQYTPTQILTGPTSLVSVCL